MKNDRLFQILYLLLEKKNITAPELAKTLEVSVRTVYRDIETLSMAGVPIYAIAGKGGGIALLDSYTFERTILSDEEQNQVLFGIQSLKAADQEVEGLLQKLGSVFQKENTINWIEVDFSRWGFRRTDKSKFEQIKQGILQRKVLQIMYCAASGEITVRSIKPIKLIYKDKSWYLQSFCMKAEDYRLFKINRIMKITLSNASFEDDFSMIPSLEQEQKSDCPMRTIRMKFSSSVAFRVFDEFSPNHIEAQTDGSFLVTVDLPVDGWVYGYLFSFGTEVEILEPKDLKNQIADYAKKIYEHHKT